VIGKRDGKYDMVEYSELSEAMANETLADGQTLRFNQGSILVFCVRSDFLMELATGSGGGADPTSLYHRASKKITHFDLETSAEVIPSEENGWKFELFLQNFLPRVEQGRLGVLTVDRASEFAPVKNANGPEGSAIFADSPAMSRKMILAEHTRWLEPCESSGLNIDPATKGNIELSFLLSYAGENLESLHAKHDGEILAGEECCYIDHAGDFLPG